MDVARELLNNLMGRDRNKPMGDPSGRDHYSSRDVCKPYLICFCFNTLFPNTVYEDGPCNKRHDAYLKNMFDNDLNRKDYEKDYIKECINWIQKRLADVEQKIKKNQSVIQTKTTFTGDRPKNVLDRIIKIDHNIENLTKQAEIFGQQGQIDDSVRCLEEVERLREERRDIQSMNDSTNSAPKQQKICEICGAIQTINDTDKRIQTHLEGKIHQGFLKLRHEVETLRVRLEILTQMDPKEKKEKEKEKEKEKQKEKEKEKQRERERQRERQREKEREKQRQRQREKEKQRERERQRQREREKQRQIEKQKQKWRERQREHDRHRGDKEKDDRHKNYDMDEQRDRRDRSRSHKKKKEKERDRSKSKQKKHKKEKDDRYRDRQREDRYGSEKKDKKRHKKSKSKSKDRSRSRDKNQDSFRERDPYRDRERERERERRGEYERMGR